MITGSPLCNGLKRSLGSKVSCQGIGSNDGYPAAMGDNGKAKGTCDACISGAVKVFERLHAKCPNSNFMFSGYSQGGALMSNTIPALSAETKAKVVGGVMFGSTRPYIPGFPKDKYEALCAKGDGVCDRSGGSFGITAGHLSYSSSPELRKAVEFLTKKAGGG
jgi:cutinase